MSLRSFRLGNYLKLVPATLRKGKWKGYSEEGSDFGNGCRFLFSFGKVGQVGDFSRFVEIRNILKKSIGNGRFN